MSGDAPTRRVAEVLVGRYRIVSGWRGGRAQAAAFCGQRRVAASEGQTLEAAVAEIETLLARNAAAFVAHRRATGRPCAAEYREVLEDLPEALSGPAMLLLHAHRHMGGMAVKIGDLARRAGLPKEEAWAVYRRLGRRLYSELKWPPVKRAAGPRYVLEAFADCSPGPDGELVIGLKPEIAEALS
jgi:hypothetical protein